ncbi:hypothetical protein BOTBODRAFT_29465 [Botryobasidium botryosum FD-172 SS1]|uniref:Aldehyde dehydrogenase domain-containing protein n=1 Tax=Botryobasidium botryosum (strain FD-172 SS1) TaxID=930990 RepID=A0A067N1U8_BOTB1|nr:hypothetical protein BOTBODRAFT_29465 [Botryobasidium botryosum FD-172 SS1]
MSPAFDYNFDLQQGFRGQSTFPTGLFIDGKFVDAIDGETMNVQNPATGEVIASVSVGNEKDVDAAVEAAARAFKTSWGLKVPGKERSRLMLKLADLLERDIDEFASIETLNCGLPFLFARYGGIANSADMLRYFAGWADKLQGNTMEVNEAKMVYTRREPLGVVAGISPWNAPLFIISAKLAPALATGNTVILKPSELTPLTTIRLCELINEAGFPPGVINVVTGTGQAVGVALSNHNGVEKVALTGSQLAGKSVLTGAANSNFKTVTLELGGKSPNIIFEDAKLEEAAEWAAFGIFFGAGQTCTAGSRIFVQESVYDRFLELFLAHIKTYTLGDPFDPATKLGPVITGTHMEHILEYIENGKKEGATLLVGGSRINRPGYYIEPTVFTDVTPDMRIFQEEIFGPVAAIAKFKDDQEALELANNTIYGLASAIFTENITRAMKISAALEAGSVYVNCYHSIEPQVPFGGYKQSGMGRELADQAIANFTQLKAVHINVSTPVPF